MSTPWLPRIRCNCATSASRGTLSRIKVSSDNRPAIIKGRAAFLAPEIGMVPLSLLPPTMRMRSMPIPAFCYAQSIGRTGPGWQKLRICGYLMGFTVIPGRCEASNPESRPEHLEIPGSLASLAPRNEDGSDRVDIFTFQNRPGIAVPCHLDHGAAELLRRGHVGRRDAVEVRQ